MSRISWDEYFMSFAIAASVRSTCDRKHVGAVIVIDKQVISTGYNGSIVGMPHCDEVGHDMVDGHCVRTIHAEMNAMAQAAKHGVVVNNSTIYVTANPCWNCFRVLISAGIREFVYHEAYRDEESCHRIAEVLRCNNIIVKILKINS